MASLDCLESQHIKFEWIVRNLGEVFDASKGENKSKVTKSPKFGGGKWQILFYANSGTTSNEGQGYASLYLSCEPTPEEREKSANGPDKWGRDGIYKFSFELRNLQKTIVFQTKEANNHSFTYKTVNWGWAQYARREHIYYNASSVRNADAFIILCTISTVPAPPAPPSTIIYRPVPKHLLLAVGSLLDDPTYSDVEFVLPRRRKYVGRKTSRPRVIYASRKILQRVEYFDTMFHSGFAEGSSILTASNGSLSTDDTCSIIHLDLDMTDGEVDDEMDATESKLPKFEDSDDEDDYMGWDDDTSDSEEADILPHHPGQRASLQTTTSNVDDQEEPKDPPASQHSNPTSPVPKETSISPEQSGVVESPSQPKDGPSETGPSETDPAEKSVDDEDRNVRRKLSHPSSPGNVQSGEARQTTISGITARTERPALGPNKVRVVVKDAPYTTYKAVLYYIYTDAIVFAPLASSFVAYSSAGVSRSPGLHGSTSESSEKGEGAYPSKSLPPPPSEPHSRREWIKQWQEQNSDKPKPCSAKAVYRLADRFDLPELKERAFQHIVKSLMVDNVAYEVFSDFSAAFEDVRKVEVEFFLENWSKIRSSNTMHNVWQQIRIGRHPGFEEVWPLIAENLEFKPKETQSE